MLPSPSCASQATNSVHSPDLSVDRPIAPPLEFFPTPPLPFSPPNDESIWECDRIQAQRNYRPGRRQGTPMSASLYNHCWRPSTSIPWSPYEQPTRITRAQYRQERRTQLYESSVVIRHSVISSPSLHPDRSYPYNGSAIPPNNDSRAIYNAVLPSLIPRSPRTPTIPPLLECIRECHPGLPELEPRQSPATIYVNNRPIYMNNADHALLASIESNSAITDIVNASEQNQIPSQQNVESVSNQPVPRNSKDSV